MSGDVVDRLYSLPLEEFTPQRDLAARELRRAGDRDAAGQLAKLPKPTPAAWTANQIAREHPDLLDELLEAGEALRRAQEEALSGGSGQVLRDAMAAQRRAVDAVMTAAQGYKPAGRALSRAMADRLRTTLQAAAGDEGLSAALAAGRLVDEAQQGGAWPLGFEVPAGEGGAKPARSAAKPAGGKKAGAKRAAARRRGGAADEATDEADEAAAREAEEEAARAAEQAERERAQREALEAELRQARGNLRVRERAVAAAEREAEEARVGAQAAAERLEAARQAVEDAEAEAEAAGRAAAEAAELLQSVRDEVARLEERLD